MEAEWPWWWAVGRALLLSPTPALGAWGVGSARWCMVITLLAAPDVSVAQLATSSSRHKCSFNVSIYTSGPVPAATGCGGEDRTGQDRQQLRDDGHSDVMGCGKVDPHFTWSPSSSRCRGRCSTSSGPLRTARCGTINLDGHTHTHTHTHLFLRVSLLRLA